MTGSDGFDNFAPRPKDPCTAAGWPAPTGRLPDIFADIFGGPARQHPDRDELRRAEHAARDAEREVERLAWQEQNRDRLAAEAKAADDARASERRAHDEHMAAYFAKIEASKKAYHDANAELERPDTDHLVLKTSVRAEVTVPDLDGLQLWSDDDPSQWELADDGATNADLIERVKSQMAAAIEPLTTHYRGLGLLRADDLGSYLMGGLSVEVGDVEFYLPFRSDDAILQPEELGHFRQVELKIDALPGAILTLSTHVRPINATKLFEAARHSLNSVGQWGGDATPSMF